MAVIADSGAVYALYDADDRHHAATAKFCAHSRDELILPATLLGELGYMLMEWLGQAALLRFLDDVEAGAFRIEPVDRADLVRCRQLISRYSDLNLGLCDASVVAIAMRLGIDRILTVDERDFRILRTSQGKPFQLLPADAAQQ